MTTVYRIIEPRDPLICGDGRPFAAGLRGRSFPWPYPSVIVGTVRTNLIPAASFLADGTIEPGLRQQLLEVRQRGALPAYAAGSDWRLAFPAPADALPTGEPGKYLPLRPAEPAPGAGTDLDSELLPARPARQPKDKLLAQPPRFWSADAMSRWLSHVGNVEFRLETGEGIYGPETESRTHVGIRPDLQTAEDTVLFSTQGLDFNRSRDGQGPKLAIYSEFELPQESAGESLNGVIPLGAERRLAHWQASKDLLASTRPDNLIRQVLNSRHLRIVLLTPAFFHGGWQPAWALAGRLPLPQGNSIAVKLVSAVVPRFAPISGWNLATRRPKPTRFLAPAGSVYFLELPQGATEAELHSLWLGSVTEEPDNRGEFSFHNDGFGLAVFGSWDRLD